ncbi:hypothetical protein L345_16590, partial [Ophiophagus hannah]
MASGGFLLLLGFLTLWAELSPVSGQDCPKKPGLCPPGPQKLPCVRKCENDRSCPGEQKCCRYGCLYECRDPIFVNKGTAVWGLQDSDKVGHMKVPLGSFKLSTCPAKVEQNGGPPVQLLLGSVEEGGSPPAWSGSQKAPGDPDFQEKERPGQNSFAKFGPAYPLSSPKLVQAL